jgi:ParB family protein of integrating conjugative element (PFGI_1 class)
MDTLESLTAAARTALSTPSRNATVDLDPHAEVDGSVSRLSIHDIEIYRHNPRTRPNPRYEDIKASIRAEGITNMLSVTRPNSSAKYSPYGGGNTRLRIAKDLFAEGDTRFETLTVIVKAWPGDAAVISAHLVENELRGSVSFWEKAQGVASVKRELEAGLTGRFLSAPELNTELRQRGLTFGLKTIQNFVFAVKHLTPIGPWLRLGDVNMLLRPAIGSYLELASKFSAEAAVRTTMEEVLRTHGEDLDALEKSNQELEQAERPPVLIDVQRLLRDLQAAVARTLSVEVEQVPLMASALAQNARLPASELRSIRATPRTAAPSATTPNSASSRATPSVGAEPTPVQRSLDGMLAPVRSAAGGGRTSKAGPASPNGPSRERLRADNAALQPIIEAINEYVPIHDFMKLMPVLPYGYMVDLPQAKDRIDDEVFAEPVPTLRSMLWQVLAMMSGQFNEIFARQIPPDPTLLWTQARAQGPQGMTRECLARLEAPSSNGRLYLSSEVLDALLLHAEVGPLANQLLHTMATIRAQNPGQFPAGYQPLFS